jgi:hypothetical protein
MTVYVVTKFQEGWKAFFSAKTIAHCPYMPASKDAEMWCEGYAYARGEENEMSEPGMKTYEF